MPATEKRSTKQNSANETDHELSELKKLITACSTSLTKLQLPRPVTSRDVWPNTVCSPRDFSSTLSLETHLLEQYTKQYANERRFAHHRKQHSHVVASLCKMRLAQNDWLLRAPASYMQQVLEVVRILARDEDHLRDLYSHHGLRAMAAALHRATDSYFRVGDEAQTVEALKKLLSVFQKTALLEDMREALIEEFEVHRPLVTLLSATDATLLNQCMTTLIYLTPISKPKASRAVAELNPSEILLRILHEYDLQSKILAARLLSTLASNENVREIMKVNEVTRQHAFYCDLQVYNGVAVLLNLLHCDNISLLFNVLWCLVPLSSDSAVSNEIRQMGGIPILLSHLQDRSYSQESTPPAAGSAGSTRSPPVHLQCDDEPWINIVSETRDKPRDSETATDRQMSLKAAVCTALTELVMNDHNAQQVAQNNGVYLLASLLLQDGTPSPSAETLQGNAFRTLRVLFSLERNRSFFKRLFPAALFEEFIDVGSYNRDINSYLGLVKHFNSLEKEARHEIGRNVAVMNHDRSSNKIIGDYAVLEHLGSGGFGSVYKVKKVNSQSNYLAMKEINTLSAFMGNNAFERNQSVGDLMSELNVMKEHLSHPNIVRYFKTFTEDDKLYIVMELLEGASLQEYCSSLAEKKEHLSEERIWKIFIQIVLALRYLHKDKGILHRDLSPNNVMLGEADKVTITDFGLAKPKHKDTSKLQSVVGTMHYRCPEIIEHKPYGDKADVWSLGCLLYFMCTLHAPFDTKNCLQLALKIVNGEYEPMPESLNYSQKLQKTVRYCLTPDPDERPDIVEVAGKIADVILIHMDTMRKEQTKLEHKLVKEQKRSQQHLNELKYNGQRLLSNRNLDYSTDGQGTKSELESDAGEVFSDPDNSMNKFRGVAGQPRHAINSSASGHQSDWPSEEDVGSSGTESHPSSAERLGRRPPLPDRSLSSPAVHPRPPVKGTPKGKRKQQTRHVVEAGADQLMLDIPATVKGSRDSGISSGDPSPNSSAPASATSSAGDTTPLGHSRSSSLGTINRSGLTSGGDRRVGSAGDKSRPGSTTSTVSISPSKVRQINDPVLQILHILHKLIYISQMPPTLTHNPKRRVVEKFKRALFSCQSSATILKNELRKVMLGSRDLIDLAFGADPESALTSRQLSLEAEATAVNSDRSQQPVYDSEAMDAGVTYEQLQTIIESVLSDTDYYSRGSSRRSPLGPIQGNK